MNELEQLIYIERDGREVPFAEWRKDEQRVALIAMGGILRAWPTRQVAPLTVQVETAD